MLAIPTGTLKLCALQPIPNSGAPAHSGLFRGSLGLKTIHLMMQTTDTKAAPALLMQPLAVRDLTLRNRVVISPMCIYAAPDDGMATDLHLVQYGRFAIGGAGLIFMEATAVEPEGRGTYGDLGLWDDRQIAPLARIAAFMREQGAVSGIQIAHAGRKASGRRPFHGGGPLTDADRACGGSPWQTVAASALPISPGGITPREMTLADIAQLRQSFASAARRAARADFQVLEIRAAHGYLLHGFLSPHMNKRSDIYGGSLGNRMRLLLEVIEAVREQWPAPLPLSVRISSVDDIAGGWSIEDSVELARQMKCRGTDLVDCSSGGIAGSATASIVPRNYGFQLPASSFQLPYSERVRSAAGIATIAVGLILEPRQAEEALQTGQADLIAIGRQALQDPNWALNTSVALASDAPAELRFAYWPDRFAWWFSRHAKILNCLRSLCKAGQ